MNSLHHGDEGLQVLTPMLPLDYNKPCSFLNHTNHHTGDYEGCSTGSYWILFVHVNKHVSAWVYVRAHLLLCLPTHLSSVDARSRGSNSLLWSAQIEHINNTINPPFQTSNSIQLRFGLSHRHLTQVRQDTAMQPLTILAVEVTANLWLRVWKQFLCLSHVFAMHPLTYFLLFSCVTQPKKTTQTEHIHLIKSFFPSTTTVPTPLFKASFSAYELFLFLKVLLQSKRSSWNQPVVPLNLMWRLELLHGLVLKMWPFKSSMALSLAGLMPHL